MVLRTGRFRQIMKRALLIFCLLPKTGRSQSDILLLLKNGRNIKTYAPGDPVNMQSIYDQWLDGTITALRHDSIFINEIPFHYKEIKTLRRLRTKLNFKQDGSILMIAGGGFVLVNVINGLYRGDPFKDWFTVTGLIVSAALVLGGFLLRKHAYATYPIGKKYSLHYLELKSEKGVNPSKPPY